MPNDTSVRSVWNMICPSCQQDDTLDVQTHVMVRITKDGTDVQESCDGSHEWDDNSKLLCASCGWTGTVNDAQIAHQQNPVHERNR
ncbi:hypothetical protein, partial [uncultured Tateyamaria sp.]|uniref:hypothetical protein n=1 Tax=uncultured Tateyamaria sp. TaxID=455651 RepID=UPI00262E327E